MKYLALCLLALVLFIPAVGPMHNLIWIFPVLNAAAGYWWRSVNERSAKTLHWAGTLPLVLLLVVAQHGWMHQATEEIRQDILESVGGDSFSPRLTREQRAFLDFRYRLEHSGGAAHLGAIAGKTPAVLGEFWFGVLICWLLNRSKHKKEESGPSKDESSIDHASLEAFSGEAPSSPQASEPPPDEPDEGQDDFWRA